MRAITDTYTGPFRDIVIYCMLKIGKNPNNCWRCGRKLTDQKRQIHHQGYENATIQDLEFGCNGCNTVEEMRGLK